MNSREQDLAFLIVAMSFVILIGLIGIVNAQRARQEAEIEQLRKAVSECCERLVPGAGD